MESLTQARHGCTRSLAIPSRSFAQDQVATGIIRKRPTDNSRYFPVPGVHKIRAAAQVLRRSPGTIRSRSSSKIQACSSPSQQECPIFAGASRQSSPLHAPCQNAASISAVLAYNANASKSTFVGRHFAFFIGSKAGKGRGPSRVCQGRLIKGRPIRTILRFEH